MPTIIPPGATLGVLRWSVVGDAEEMITTLGLTSPLTPQEEATALYTAATNTNSVTPVTAMNKPWTFVGTTVYQRGLAGDPIVAFHNEPITQVAGSETALPSNCALLVHKVTATAGRKGRGRFFAPPALVDEASVDTNGTISATPYNIINGRWDAFHGLLVTAGLQPVLFHADGSAPTEITDFVLDTRIATQRKRMRR